MKSRFVLILSFVFNASCIANSRTSGSEISDSTQQSAVSTGIKGKFLANSIHTSKLLRPLQLVPLHLTAEKIDQATSSLSIDLDANGEGTMSGQSTCRELGIATMNFSIQFVPKLILASEGFKDKLHILSTFSDESKCGLDYGEQLVTSTRKVYQLKNFREEPVDKLALDVFIPGTNGLLNARGLSFNTECKNLHNRKLVVFSIENPSNDQPYQLNGEPVACVGFKDKELKQLRLLFVHQETGATMVDYVAGQ